VVVHSWASLQGKMYVMVMFEILGFSRCLGGVAVTTATIILKHMAKNLFHVNVDTIKWAGQQY
jgi:hypothetical protein